MKIFNEIINEIEGYKYKRQNSGLCREFQADKTPSWPGAGKRDIILMPDLAVEFGSP
jgi:hypothetical protein